MKKMLFTGASGFLGRYTQPILEQTYEITTVGLTDKDNYQVNITKDIPELKESYNVVLHAAGKAHIIPKTEEEKKAFFEVNLEGTKNLCTALEKIGVPENLIFISTVAVYGCDVGEEVRETHALEGTTPYALSKIQAEQFLEKWCKKNNVCLSIIRPSLIAGPNAPGNLGAMVKGIKTGKYLSIAGGKACKSVLMVEDIARLIPLLENKGGIYNVCDNSQPSFRELEKVICKQLNKKLPLSIPIWVAKCLARIGDLLGKKAPINSERLTKIVCSLTFSNKKAQKELNWKPLNVLENYKIEE